jgi:glucose/mannose-6-phosphate isomerase
MSSGGRLEELARKAKVPHLTLPAGYPPRAAVGYSLGAMLAIFDGLYGLNRRAEFVRICEELERDVRHYRSLNVSVSGALELAANLVAKTPVIYAVDGFVSPALSFRFRAQLAEMSKVWSHGAELPEMAHNEVESWSFLGQLLPPPVVLFLGSWAVQGQFMDPRPAMRQLLDARNVEHLTLDPTELWNDSESRLAQGLRTMLRLDAATIYLAVLRALDPQEIPTITELKKSTTPA